MEKRRSPESTKKETQKYYNYGVKGYLARDYKKLKTKIKLYRKQQAQEKFRI